MGAGGYVPNQRDHTFKSGRTMVIRRALPATWLAVEAAKRGGDAGGAMADLLSGGQVADPSAAVEVMATIIEHMFVRPRVVWDPLDVPEGVEVGADGWPPVISAIDLLDSEIDEVLDLALGGVAEAASFRGDGDGVGDGGDGTGVAVKSKPRARAARGKS